jgi:phosphatidylglycerol lysyltransferase
MNKRLLEIVGSVVAMVLFTVALWVLHRELAHHSLADIIAQLRSIPVPHLLLAFLFTVLSYLALSGYDMLALRYIKHPIEYPKVAMTSFITYAIAHNLGFSVFTGGSLRYRIYGAWGLSAFEITSLMGFGVVTFWLGYLTAAAITLTTWPLAIPTQIRLPFESTFPLGLLMLVILLAYLTWILIIRRPLKIREWQFDVPSRGATFAQMGLGMFDWLVASAAVFIVLPDAVQVSYLHVLAIFLLAQIAGLVSNVPGGLGVFETVFILLIGPVASPAELIGSLLAYRIIYYLVPLVLAASSLAAFEVSRRAEGLMRLATNVARWISMFAPQLFSFLTFVAGVVLLFSGATPAETDRLEWITEFLPLPVIEISHFIGSIVGLGLLLLARGLQRRVDGAYVLSLALLGVGIVVSLLKGFDYEEALILTLMFVLLLPSRSYFYRKSSLLVRSLSPAWIVAIAVVLGCSFWLTMFSFKHVEYGKELWWQFEIFGDAPRSLRAGAGAIGAAMIMAMWQLLRPTSPEPTLPTSSALDRVSPIVRSCSSSVAHLALLGDKEFLFSQDGRAFVMYGVAGRSWVAMGDPVGPREEWKELLWQFHELSDRHGGWTIFYQVDAENLPLYLDMGLSLLKLGEEARVPLLEFSLEGHTNKPFRHWHRKPESEGCSFEVVAASEVARLLPRLREISDVWVEYKNTREKRFSLGYFHEPYLLRTPMALVWKAGEIIAFANIWATDDHEELSIDLMRHLPDAPAGVMDYMFIELMLYGRQQGYRWFNLGMAPLSGLDNRIAAPFWNQLGTFIFRHGEHFYNFQGLRLYKEKYRPVWTPRYLASPGGVAVLRILTNIASMISGGITGVVRK